MNKELFTIGSSGDKDIASCSWTGGDAESSIRDAEIARCVDRSGDDCSGFERGNPASCPTSCEYTAPNAAIECYLGGRPDEEEEPRDRRRTVRFRRRGRVSMAPGPAGRDRHRLRDTNTCQSPYAAITERDKCEAAATLLGNIEDTTATAVVDNGPGNMRSDHPHGCYFDVRDRGSGGVPPGILYINDAGDTNQNDQYRMSICEDSSTLTPATVTQMTTGTCPPPFAFIETAFECEAVANVLGLDDTTATAVVGNMRADHPHGCYLDRQSGMLYINDSGDRNNNDQNRVSICYGP